MFENQTKLLEMLRLQDEMNTVVNPNWLQQGWDWSRAIMVEAVEAIEHHGWKWWKKQDIDWPQLKMELVDIWHFALSKTLVNAANKPFDSRQALHQVAADQILAELEDKSDTEELASTSLLDKLEALVSISSIKQFNYPLFFSLLADCDMDLDALYRMYVAKNVLNKFRQNNGYKQGTYVKVFDGKEDNEHLVELMESIDHNHSDYFNMVYAAMDTRYREFN